GPVVGGFLVEEVSWQSIFFLNVPVAALAIVVALFAVHESRDETAIREIDYPGVATISIGLAALVLALVKGNAWGWGSPKIDDLRDGHRPDRGAPVRPHRLAAADDRRHDRDRGLDVLDDRHQHALQLRLHRGGVRAPGPRHRLRDVADEHRRDELGGPHEGRR